MKRRRIIAFWIAMFACSFAANAQVADTNVLTADSLLPFIDSLAVFQDISVTQDTSVVADTSAARDTIAAERIVTDTVRRETAASTCKQGYEIAGVVKDKNTGEGVPFATVFLAGTGIGTAADLDGNFLLKIPDLPKDTLRIQAVGYNTVNRKLDRQKNSYSFFIELERADNVLEEFVVHPGEDPAVTLLKLIIEHKPENNPDRTENYKYEVYNKLEVDLQRLSKEQFEKLPVPYMKKFSFIYNNLDSTSEQTPFLPFYLTETLSDYYFQRNPKKAREFIHASQIKGFKNESITKFMGSMYQNINSYDNFIPVFDKQFVSPISNQGLFYYKYKIKDTQQAYGHDIVLVQFVPRRNGENCFYGDFWVVDSVYALQRISMEVPKDANINWVSRVSLYQEFAPVKDSLWFCVKDNSLLILQRLMAPNCRVSLAEKQHPTKIL